MHSLINILLGYPVPVLEISYLDMRRTSYPSEDMPHTSYPSEWLTHHVLRHVEQSVTAHKTYTDVYILQLYPLVLVE